MKCLICILTALFVAEDAMAASWEVFTNKNSVRDIVTLTGEDRMFFATDGGLIEFSRSPDTVITYWTTIQGLSSNDLNCLSMDASGNLLIGTAMKGIAILFVDDEVKNYSTLDGLPSDQVTCIVVGDGEFWVGTAEGAVRMELEGESVNRKSSIYFGDPLNYEVRDFHLDGSRVWFATSEGLWLLEDDEFQSWLVGQGLIDNSVRDLLKVGGDSLIVATDSGIQVFFPDSGLFHDFSVGLVSSNSKQVREIAPVDGQLWAATRGGIYRYDAGQAGWVDETLDLPTRNILALDSDYTGVPILGTDGKGVSSRGEGTWSTLEFPGPLVNSLDRVIVDSRGVIWASSWSATPSKAGIFRYDGETYQNYTKDNSGLLYNLASSLNEAPDGSLWIGTPWYNSGGSGLSILDDGGTPQLEDDTWITLSGTDTGLSGDAIRSEVVFKGDGEAWIGSWDQEKYNLPGGLDVLHYGQGEFSFRSFDQLVGDRRIQALAVDGQGDLWIGYTKTGVDLFVLRPVTAGGDSLFFSIDPDLVYLSGENVLDLEVDPLGHLWICTTSGVTELDYANDPLSSSNFKWRSFTIDNSMIPDVRVNGVAFHGSRFVWFATPSGAAKYDRDLDVWEIFDTNGSPIPEDDVKDVFVDENTGAVWFATKGGLARFYRIGGEPPVSESGSIIVAPNPYLPTMSPQGVIFGRFDPGTVLDIYNIAGSHIVKLVAQTETIKWDGKDENGTEIASGIYLLISKSPGGKIGKGKIAIVR
ncbi:MAG: hypothetical protein ACE5OP_06480 [Candidatus Glassbacteria bacterium]